MRAGLVIGFVLIALGVAALVYQGFSYTTRKKTVEIGSLEITEKQKHTIPVPPILGGAAVLGGIVLIAASGRK